MTYVKLAGELMELMIVDGLYGFVFCLVVSKTLATFSGIDNIFVDVNPIGFAAKPLTMSKCAIQYVLRLGGSAAEVVGSIS